MNKVLLLVFAVMWDFPATGADAVKREFVGQSPGLESLQLGHLGPVSRLASHQSIAPLGLTPHQAIGFLHVLLQNGFIVPGALRLASGGPFFADPFLGNTVPTAPTPFQFVDPYISYLLTNNVRYLPYGLGLQGIYGSTGLPKPKPLGIFKYNDKN